MGTEGVIALFRIADVSKQVPDILFAYTNGADHLSTLTHPNEVFHFITQFLSE